MYGKVDNGSNEMISLFLLLKFPSKLSLTVNMVKL